jgi:hypothetical protein
MYRGFEDQRQRVPAENIYQIKYEDLVADPVEQIGHIYERLNLGDYSLVRESIAAAVSEQKDYKTNKHELDELLKAKIRERWAGYFERYGYQ